jgi:hypothetical protein
MEHDFLEKYTTNNLMQNFIVGEGPSAKCSFPRENFPQKNFSLLIIPSEYQKGTDNQK